MKTTYIKDQVAPEICNLDKKRSTQSRLILYPVPVDLGAVLRNTPAFEYFPCSKALCFAGTDANALEAIVRAERAPSWAIARIRQLIASKKATLTPVQEVSGKTYQRHKGIILYKAQEQSFLIPPLASAQSFLGHGISLLTRRFNSLVKTLATKALKVSGKNSTNFYQ